MPLLVPLISTPGVFSVDNDLIVPGAPKSGIGHSPGNLFSPYWAPDEAIVELGHRALLPPLPGK